jgi:hypothetical protein
VVTKLWAADLHRAAGHLKGLKNPFNFKSFCSGQHVASVIIIIIISSSSSISIIIGGGGGGGGCSGGCGGE